MTWGEFKELFMGKFFLASARHAKSWKFLEFKQGNMIVLEYVANSLSWHVSRMTMWPQIWTRCENSRMT